MANVKVFMLNECDAVAAETVEQAKEWYMEKHKMTENEAFYDYQAHTVPLTHEVWEDETKTRTEVLADLIVEFWEGTPFVIFSTEP